MMTSRVYPPLAVLWFSLRLSQMVTEYLKKYHGILQENEGPL